MKRIRTLGIAAVAAMALTVTVGAGTASASGPVSNFESTISNDSISGVGEGTLQLQGSLKNCSQLTISGTLPGKASSELEMAFASNCTLASNGCEFIFHPGTEDVSYPGAGRFEGSADIGPEGCGPATVKYGLFDKCTASIPAQSGLNATFENLGEGAVRIEVSTNDLEYTASGPGAWGCANETLKTGAFDASWEAQGEGNFQVAGVPSGIYLAGEKSEKAAQQPRFEAEAYPTGFSGEEDATQLPTFSLYGGATTTKCSQAWFFGTLGSATSALPVSAEYSQCKTGTLPATVRPFGDCHFVLNALNAGPPYTGSVDFGCSESEGIEVLTYASLKAQQEGKVLCEAVITPQNGITGVSYTNVGEGSGRSIQVKASLSGIEYAYTRYSAVCPGSGSGVFKNGAFSLQTELAG